MGKQLRRQTSHYFSQRHRANMGKRRKHVFYTNANRAVAQRRYFRLRRDLRITMHVLWNASRGSKESGDSRASGLGSDGVALQEKDATPLPRRRSA